MITIKNYQIAEEIYNSPKRIVYRGIRLSDQQPVILKCFGTAYPTSTEIVRLQHEYRITKNLKLSGIVKTLDLLTDNYTPILICEDMGGISLKQYLNCRPIEVGKFLEIAIQLAQTLEELHQYGIVHKDIKPSNIILNPHTVEAKLTDFAIASQLVKEHPTISHPNLLEGSLAYMSPEQTGRMNRSIDYRTDFYSLGVTFYEMLTGQLPCYSDDSMELVHCHIARTPVPPNQINLQIPPVVSNLIMKLLGKTPEERYQSGFGLKIDLGKCLNQWQEKGEISEFTSLATRDFSGELQIPQKLYGREEEVNQLLETFDRIASGNTEMMLVSGYSGIGKTSAVNEIHKPIVRQRGYFIAGKFDQFKRNIPYSALIQAFSDLMRQLVTENQAKVATWKSNLLEALGQNGQAIVDVIPEVEWIVGKQPEVVPLGPTESQNRFIGVFQKFISVFTQKEHPLVLFLDDLQWADSASLKLIESIVTDATSKYLFLIGSYRDNEVSPTHTTIQTIEKIQQTGATVNNIVLQPLKLENVRNLVRDTLVETGTSSSFQLTENPALERINLLAELLFNKTQGNPFFLTTLLSTLYSEKLLTFDFSEGRWLWDLEQIQALGITDYNVVELVARNIQKLPAASQQVLKLAACIGNTFNLDTLAIVNEKSLLTTADELWETLQAGLILPLSSDYQIPLFVNEPQQKYLQNKDLRVNYKFLHDRVQQAAYSLIPEADGKITHLKIGQLLLQKTANFALAENLFDIVNQLNIGREFITAENEKEELTKLNLIAGKKALAATAYDGAARYLNVGLQLLPENSWETKYELTRDLYTETAAAEYLNTNFQQAKQLSDIILQKARTLLEKVPVCETQIHFYIAQNQMQSAIDTALEVLKMLGVSLPKKPNKFNILIGLIQTKIKLAGNQIEALADWQEMTDAYQLASMRILITVTPATFIAKPELLPLVIFKLIELSVKYGNSPFAAYAYGYYAFMLCSGFGDIDSGYRFGKLSLQVLNKFYAREIKPKVELLFHTGLKHWKEPFRDTIEPLFEGIQQALEVGDLESACHNAMNYCCHILLSGDNLELVEQEQLKYMAMMHKCKQEFQLINTQIWAQFVANLLEKGFDKKRLVGENFDEVKTLPLLLDRNNGISIFNVYFLKAWMLFLGKDYAGAIAQAELAENYLGKVSGMSVITNHTLYYSLALLAQYPHVSKSEQKQYLTQVESNQKRMKKWAFHCQANCQHKYELVEAEKARVLGQDVLAMQYYDLAIQGAKQQGYIQEEALANELAAEFYFERDRHKFAQLYLTEAYYTYIRWGSSAKVHHLEQRYPFLITRQLDMNSPQNETVADSTISRSSSYGSILDINTIFKASQAIASKIDLNNLLAKLMKIVIENGGAQSGILLLNREDKLLIEAEGIIEPDLVLVRQSMPVDESDRLPLSIINYVARTQEDVVLTNASERGNFINDLYILAHQTKSVLCTPILSQGKLIGILYLENNLIAGAFTPERTQLLKLLCSQAAISLENAQLYEAQKEYTKTLERQVQERTQELQQQKALFDAFFTASKAGFIIYDKELRYVQVNETIAKVNGMPAADHIGKTLREVVPHIAPIVEPTFQQILATGEPVLNVEVSGETASQPGVELHWLVSYFPLPGLDGKPIGVGTVLVEISDRKRAEEALRQSEERWHLALKGSNDGIWDWNLKTNESFVSARMKEMLGYEDRELANHADEWGSRIHPDDSDRVWDAFQAHLERKTPYFVSEFRQRCKDGSYKWILSRAQAVWDEEGKPMRIVGSNTDISDRKRAEEALRQSEALLTIAQKVAHVGSWEFDLATGKISWTEEVFRICGFDPNQPAPSFSELIERIHPHERTSFEENVRRAVTEGTSYEMDYRHYHSDGSIRYLEARGKAIFNEQGQAIKLFGAVLDITDRKRAEEALQESERVFRAIFNGAMDAITITDDTAQYVDANPAACQLFGLSKEELLKTKISDFNEPGIDFALIWQHFLEQGQFAGEYRLHRFNGTVRDVEFSASANFIPHRHLSVLRDISDRKLAEAALQQAKEAADAASRAKGEFLSKMSHELRTPLNAILGFSQLLNRDLSLTSQQQEYLGIINRAGEHLLILINDVLEMSKIEAGRIGLNETTFDLYHLLRSLKEMFQLRAESKGLKLIFHRASDVPQYVKTDESKLRQILINLIGNAIKFTERGNITLRVITAISDRLDNSHSHLYFEIEDTGPGIAPEEIDTIFEAFVQTKTGRQAESGTGLGLPISRQFVQLMGGEITVSSILHQGTIFKFNIQIKLPEVTEISTPTATRRVIRLEPDQPHYRILVVEDKSESRLLLVTLLSQAGFEVKDATNGQAAIELAESWKPDLIWMDMQMPIVNGFDATKQIRAKEKQNSQSDLISTTHPIIIALTANAFAEDKAAVLEAGCNDFVSKPFPEAIIFDKIAQYLGVRYVYEKLTLPNPELPTENHLTAELFYGISVEWITELYQVVSELDDERAGYLIEQIRACRPVLANALEKLNKKLRFDTILDVIKKLGIS